MPVATVPAVVPPTVTVDGNAVAAPGTAARSPSRSPKKPPPSILLPCGTAKAQAMAARAERDAAVEKQRQDIANGVIRAAPAHPPVQSAPAAQQQVKASSSAESLQSSVPSSSPSTTFSDVHSHTGTSETSWATDDAADKPQVAASPAASAAAAPASPASTVASVTTPTRPNGVPPSIRFGACPERPIELRRRNSITLGVLARKNMLHAQGSYSAPGNGVRKVMMTDEEWEEYQRNFNAKNQTTQAVDLGAVVSSGAKKFFNKMRRGSNSSVTSNSSNASSAAAAGGRGRSDSAPGAPPIPVSPRARPVDVGEALVEEEEEQPSPAPGKSLGLTALDGDQTPRRMSTPPPRSPVPTSAQLSFDDEDENEDNAQNEDAKHSHDVAKYPGYDDHDMTHRDRQSNHVAALGFELSHFEGSRSSWEPPHGTSHQDGMPQQRVH